MTHKQVGQALNVGLIRCPACGGRLFCHAVEKGWACADRACPFDELVTEMELVTTDGEVLPDGKRQEWDKWAPPPPRLKRGGWV